MMPEDWTRLPLDAVASVQTGIAKGKPVRNDNLIELPYLRVANVQDGHVDLTDVKFLDVDPSAVERFGLRSGDVLFTEGGDFDKLGRGCVWRGQLDPCLHQNHVFAVRPLNDRLSPEFLAFYAMSPHGRAYFLGCAKQTTHLASINSTQLRSFPVPIPPLSEQHKIVAILLSVDDTIEKNKAVIEQLLTLKYALLEDMLACDALNRVTQPDIVPLGSILYELYRYPTYYRIVYQHHGVLEIRGELICSDGSLDDDPTKHRFVSPETAACFPKVRLESGDFVMSVRGTVGKIGMVPDSMRGALITANLIRLSPDRKRVQPSFLKHVLLSAAFQARLQQATSSTTIKTIQVPQLRGLPVPLPPIHRQTEIAEALDALDRRLVVERQVCGQARHMKEALMSVLLTGELRVKVDEPARDVHARDPGDHARDRQPDEATP